MTSELFLKVLEHVRHHTNCTKENNILLLLDNHDTHISVKSINFCCDNGVIMVSFPPHTSHKLQPLDVGIYGPFKTYCSVAFNDWITTNPGKVITIREIAQLSKIAFQAAFAQRNITKSFEKPELWPLNRLVFRDEDFAASYVNVSNDEHLEESHVQHNQHQPSTPSTHTEPNRSFSHADDSFTLTSTPPTSADAPSTSYTQLASQRLSNASQGNAPSCSTAATLVSFCVPSTFHVPLTPPRIPNTVPTNQDNTHSCSTAGASITPDAVRPYPRPCLKKKKKRVTNKSGKSRIYTDTPEKQRLEEIEAGKESRKKKQEERKRRVTKQVFPNPCKK